MDCRIPPWMPAVFSAKRPGESTPEGPSGQGGSEKRRTPYVPIFRRTPARMTEPAVGASTCASGSQVWNGNIGTLIAKPMKKAQKSQSCRSGGIEEAIVWKWTMSNVGGFPRPFHQRKPDVLKK